MNNAEKSKKCIQLDETTPLGQLVGTGLHDFNPKSNVKPGSQSIVS